MKPDLTNDVLHNPFKNRFNDPVTWRLDEMQAHSNVIRERQPKHEGGIFVSIFALSLVLLATVFVLFR